MKPHPTRRGEILGFLTNSVNSLIRRDYVSVCDPLGGREAEVRSAEDSLLAAAVVGAAAQRHADHAAGEGHEERVVIPIQLQAQNPPVLPLHVTSGGHRRTPTVTIATVHLHLFFAGRLRRCGNNTESNLMQIRLFQAVQSEDKRRL